MTIAFADLLHSDEKKFLAPVNPFTIYFTRL